MSSKILLSFLGGCLALFLVMGITTNNTEAQVAASGKLETPASQIIAPVLEEDLEENDPSVNRHTHVTITNTSSDPVTVHVQFLIDENECGEVDFFDTFTGQDTHTYYLDEECAVNDGAPGSCPINVNDRDGLWVVTPVVSAADPTAIAFNHLHGVVHQFNGWDLDTVYRYNAIGRSAVNEAGGLLADGTPLDGGAAFLEAIVPDEIIYHYLSLESQSDPTYADLILVAISDNYSAGAAGYKAVGGDAAYEAFKVCDYDESCISCDTKEFTCIDIYGINNTVEALDDAGPVICDEAGNPPSGLDQLLLNDAGADVIFGVLGLTTSDVGGAAHVFVK